MSNNFSFPQRLIAAVLLYVLSSCTSTQPPLMELPPPTSEQVQQSLAADNPRFSVLVFSRTTGFRHTSIPQGIGAVEKLGQLHQFSVDATEDPALFTPENLVKYDAVIFMNTNGIDVLGPEQKTAFEGYIQTGGGYVGVHSAAATEYEWPWYNELVGAYFDNHPEPQEADVLVLDRVHPSTVHLPARWRRFDEWYNYRTNPRNDVHVLAVLDERSYEGGEMGHDHPIVWAHEFDGGRAWYTGLGHTEESYEDPTFLQHLLGGIEWAAGFVEGDVRATLAENYNLTVLMERTTDPMELAVAEDGRVFVAERAGAIRMWDPSTQKNTLVGWIPVYMVIEDGLLGLTLDPNFMENNWLYVYYAPEDAGPSRLSRFTLVDNKLDMESEKILLEVPVQRVVCCHAAGSLAFDPQGNLYLATGDNTDPYDREGAPIDERPGRENADEQRGTANTNNLRGKILRIHPEPDGSYTIPEGNLFDADSLHRPEIYTMGHRNPFRIAIDPETGWVYWGDVGHGDPPNARGGWGWDEFNQARGPGFFGWPYFVGNNEAYNDYDYETGEIGPPFDPAAPINDSPNNTGARELPPAQPAMIWYTYGASEDFPELGAGGVNPMAGPILRRQPSHGPNALPDYFVGKHIIYEWMRNWLMVASFDENGDLMDISPFLPGIEFVRPMDVELGPDGALYVIEWGDAFWGSNENARVVRLAYGEISTPESDFPISDWRLKIEDPQEGVFFAFDEPLEYRVSVWDGSGNAVSDAEVSVQTYSGFDTNALPLETLSGDVGTFAISRKYTHTPDLHYIDRFAEVEACVTDDAGLQACDRVKLQPRHKEAEHISWKEGGDRVTHGTHPASQHYPLTALTTMRLKPGDALGYSPIDLAGVSSITIRYKAYGEGTLELRSGGKDGVLLESIEISGTASIPKTTQGSAIDDALTHDEALAASEFDRSVYEDWSETTVQVSGDGDELVLVVSGEGDDVLVEVDWVRFE